MKKKVTVLSQCLACLLFLFGVTGLHAETNPKPFVVPELQSWTGGEGRFVPGSESRIVVKGKDKELKRVAQAFATDYYEMFGKQLEVKTGKAREGDFVFELSMDEKLGKEGYRLDIAKNVRLTANTAQGVYWGTRTLLQLAEQSADRSLPCGQSEDVPQYALRGFMIDCGRKYIPMAYLKDLVKMMSYYKMNTLQVHLNDNGFPKYFGGDWDKTQAAFRLECETYPGLTAKDGSYTKQEFVDFQLGAAAQFVEIIPEIDIPAHSLAFSHYKPELGSKEYGMDHLDLSNPEVYPFFDGLFKEYLEGKEPVFRGKRVHIGTDEYSNAKQEVVEQFRAFTDHYIKYVESFGKQAMVWGALTHAKGKTPVKVDNVVMNCWSSGFADPKAMKELGYQLVSIPDGYVYIVPEAGYYYDYLNCKMLYENWTPAQIGNQKFEEQDPSILGGMFAVWNDHAGNGVSVKDIHHRVVPAMQTLAVKCWTGRNTQLPYETFDKQRVLLSEGPGVNQLGRWYDAKNHRYVLEPAETFTQAAVAPGAKLPAVEIGYDYTVTFTVNAKEEAKGTELFRSPNAVFYLSDPEQGKLGFARDGYLNTFNYRLPVGQEVTLTVQGTNRVTRLFVNGKLQQELPVLTLYTFDSQRPFKYEAKQSFEPVIYTPTSNMRYTRTLVFPLEQAGQFKSTVTNLKVYNYVKK